MVVDRKRNIGALVVARARVAGNTVVYLPGSVEKALRDAKAGVARTDRIDAEVIARVASACRTRLDPSPRRRPRAAARLPDRLLHPVEAQTKNRLRGAARG